MHDRNQIEKEIKQLELRLAYLTGSPGFGAEMERFQIRVRLTELRNQLNPKGN